MDVPRFCLKKKHVSYKRYGLWMEGTMNRVQMECDFSNLVSLMFGLRFAEYSE